MKNRTLTPQGQPPTNTGRISIIEKNGKRGTTILAGLPISVTTTIPHGKLLYIEVGAWDEVIPGPIPGTEIPNPNPSSPILASILILTLPAEVDELRSGFSITLDDHTKLLNKTELHLQNGHGQHARLSLLTKFQNYTPAPVPGVPNAVKGSNPFGMVESKGALYISDAAQNTVVKVDVKTGEAQTLLAFPQMSNAGGMPPTMDAVPDSIRIHNDRLLVPLLSGYPFPAGAAQVRSVGFDGSNQPFINGLNSAIDVLPVKLPSKHETFFVLEYSLDQNQNKPGRLSRYDSPAGPQVFIADNLTSPTNLAYDEHSHTLYISEIFAGNIRKLSVE